MGSISPPKPVLLLVAVSSRYEGALDWAREKIAAEFGPAGATSPAFDFTETDYYATTMGSDLLKQFVVPAAAIDPGRLPAIKRLTNQWEADYIAATDHPEPRPLNLDPGYLTMAKLVLASTKDHAHRLYLGEGIYGEITLSFRAKAWHPAPWTYPDYRRSDFQQFFTASRELLRLPAAAGIIPAA